jgi:hypothetical protein
MSSEDCIQSSESMEDVLKILKIGECYYQTTERYWEALMS